MEYDSEGEYMYSSSLSMEPESDDDDDSCDVALDQQYINDKLDPVTVIKGIFHLADSETENIEVEIKHVFISLVNLYQKVRMGVPATESCLPLDFSRYFSANGKSGVMRGRCGELVSLSGSPKKRYKTDGLLPPPPQKNTVAMLNELRQGLVYELEGQTGPVHAPVFTMSVIVDGEKYVGQGRSKKVARIEAAAAALKSFIQFKDGTALNALKPIKNIDFTSDDHLENELAKPVTYNADGPKQMPEKGPVMLLYELFTDVAFECNSSDGPPHSRFKMTVKVNEQNFVGTGSSKKLAKNAAAKAALAALCNISYSPMQQVQPNMNPADTLSMDLDQNITLELPQLFADTIGKLVVEKFSDLMIGNSQFAKRKVLAGIVMTENFDVDSARVITISTGTKCINGEHMSVSGCVLNDSHAEIVSRRCLMDFFYTQLELLTIPGGDSIFMRSNEPDDKFPYKLKPGIRFHLYINTSPCGDARIFSPHEDDLGVDKHPNRKARGQLRNKIEAGEGTIPAKSSDGIQTWDGIIQGQRLLTMSCSDKIARWNVLGIQGALLSSIFGPIYLYSIVLGRLLHPAHMYRAVYGRLEGAIEELPPPYQLNKPKLAEVTSSEVRNQSKAPSFGINWTVGNTEIEVVNSITGKTASTKVSRLTKLNFFRRFANLAKNLPGLESCDVSGDYGETKATVIDYNVAKNELFAAFRRKDLGNWLKKPIDQDQFMLPE